MAITSETSLPELAALVSMALEEAGIKAVLSGGAAVSIYSNNAYESADLDFVTSAGKKALAAAIKTLGFKGSNTSRMFQHPDTDWYVEFPSGPLSFGDTYMEPSEIPLFHTQYGEIKNNHADVISD